MSGTSSTSIRPQYRTIDGVRTRFAESDARDADSLLFCPWPESMYAYESIWARLAQHAHLIAVDLPGFGGSDRDNNLMSPHAMGEFVVHVADAFGLANPHVVGPDVSTGATLFAAAMHPGRMRSLVVGTGATAVPLDVGDPLKEWVFAPSLDPYRKIDGRQIVAAAVSTLERYKLTDAAREDYLASYAGDRFAESIRYVQTYPKELPVLGEKLKDIQTPIQIIAGKRDTVVPPINAEFLHERLPKSKLDFIDAGHFVWEDGADQYAALVTSWWNGGYAKVGAAKVSASSHA